MSTLEELKELPREELVEMAEMLHIKTPDAINPSKPNKTELATVIAEHQAKVDAERAEEDGELITIPKTEGRIAPTKTFTRAQLNKMDVMRKIRVIIHDNQATQTKEDTVTVSWGNRAIGGQTDLISLGGEPQYVRQGALNNLRDAMTTIQTLKSGPAGGVQKVRKPRFVVVEVEGLTQDELEALADKQRLRNAKNVM